MSLSPRLLAVAALLLCALAAIFFWPRRPKSPEELVRAQVRQMLDAVSEKDLSTLMEPISERFTAQEGVDRQQLKGILASQLLRNDRTAAFATTLAVNQTSPEQVTMKGTFLFGRTQAKTLAEVLGQGELSSYDIEARFEREADGLFRVVWAHYAPTRR